MDKVEKRDRMKRRELVSDPRVFRIGMELELTKRLIKLKLQQIPNSISSDGVLLMSMLLVALVRTLQLTDCCIRSNRLYASAVPRSTFH